MKKLSTVLRWYKNASFNLILKLFCICKMTKKWMNESWMSNRKIVWIRVKISSLNKCELLTVHGAHTLLFQIACFFIAQCLRQLKPTVKKYVLGMLVFNI